MTMVLRMMTMVMRLRGLLLVQPQKRLRHIRQHLRQANLLPSERRVGTTVLPLALLSRSLNQFLLAHRRREKLGLSCPIRHGNPDLRRPNLRNYGDLHVLGNPISNQEMSMAKSPPPTF